MPKYKYKQAGFTIVELLVVIVVIAILAAITIVAYNGIQNRAKTNAGKSLAASTVKKIEILNSIKGGYFDAPGGKGADVINPIANQDPVAKEAVISPESSVTGNTYDGTFLTADFANGGKTVGVWGCQTGALVYFYNYTTNTQDKLTAGKGCS